MEADTERPDVRNSTLPQEVLEKLKCFICEEYLSRLPIYVYPYQKALACGRCPVLFEEEPIPNKTLETLSSYLYFPCKYKNNGCVESIALAEMKTHEDYCTYKQHFCPVIPLGSCSWQGNFNELIDHYKEYHEELFLETNKFQLSLSHSSEQNYVLLYEDHAFIFYLNCDVVQDTVWYLVSYVSNQNIDNKYKYKIRLLNDVVNKTATAPENLVKNVDVHGNKCAAHKFKIVDVRCIVGDLCSVECFISPNNLLIENKKHPKAENASDELVLELECPVCNWYMCSPIYLCAGGHSICNNCLPGLQNCPICRGPMSNTRNFTLEKLSNSIKLYCENKRNGCPTILSVSECENHFIECEFKYFECPFVDNLECDWKGDDVLGHSLDKHKDCILVNSSVVYFSLEKTNSVKLYLINAYDRLFKLFFKYEDEHFYWSVQSFKEEEDIDLYGYELDILDYSEISQRFYLKKKCSQCTLYDTVFSESSNYVKIPYELISPLIVKEVLVYKFKVIKNEI